MRRPFALHLHLRRERAPAAGGDWIYDRFNGSVGPNLVGYSFRARALGIEGNICLHDPDGHGLKYELNIRGNQAPVPRGAFNPRFDRKYEHTYTDTAFEGPEHGNDPNQVHTFRGSSRVTVKIKAVSEKKWDKKDVKYRDESRGDIFESG